MQERQRVDTSFIRGWLRRPLKMGAVSPSSKALGRLMASFLPSENPDGVVLELGPGTGVVTQCLLDAGVAPGALTCLEYAPEFCVLLRTRFPGVHVLQGDAYRPGPALAHWIGKRPIRAVVSSLPLMTRPEAERTAAVSRYLDLVPPGAPFIQFTYALALPVRPQRVAALAEVSPWVKRNLPPARVVVYRRPEIIE